MTFRNQHSALVAPLPGGARWPGAGGAGGIDGRATSSLSAAIAQTQARDRPHGQHAQYLIVGGGLAGGLIALALAQTGRGGRVMLVEGGDTLGGNHTWSFHDGDLDWQGHQLVRELVTHRWPRQLVRFPEHERTLRAGYSSISSDRFARVLRMRLLQAGVRIQMGRRVAKVGGDMVQLEGGDTLTGDLVVDGRGPVAAATPADVDGAPGGGGYQKFVGLEVALDGDGPWTLPLLMDATVPQVDGFRFTYVLPFSRRRVLIEDTIYSTNATLDVADCERRILAYLAAHAQSGQSATGHVLRREWGVLPLPGRLSRRPGVLGESRQSPLEVGYRGGFFHAVTGYSLPLAVRVALAIARAGGPAEARLAIQALDRDLAPQHRFGCLLNRLMFRAMPAASRWTAFRRFYRLPEATIARFYASRSTAWDRARLLIGRPPAGISWKGLLGAGTRTLEMKGRSEV